MGDRHPELPNRTLRCLTKPRILGLFKFLEISSGSHRYSQMIPTSYFVCLSPLRWRPGPAAWSAQRQRPGAGFAAPAAARRGPGRLLGGRLAALRALPELRRGHGGLRSRPRRRSLVFKTTLPITSANDAPLFRRHRPDPPLQARASRPACSGPVESVQWLCPNSFWNLRPEPCHEESQVNMT